MFTPTQPPKNNMPKKRKVTIKKVELVAGEQDGIAASVLEVERALERPHVLLGMIKITLRRDHRCLVHTID